MSDKQEMALELAVCGLTDVEIARRVGVSRQWVNKWRNQDRDFKEAIAEQRQRMRERHMDRISQLLEQAIGVLEETMATGDEQAKLKTAMYVLKISGLQGYAKPPNPLSQEEEDKQTLSEALGQVAIEMGFGKGFMRG